MRLFLLLVLFSCSEIFIPNNDNYKSIHLNQGGWIEIENQYDCENGLRVIDDTFSLEIYFSGDNSTNTGGTLFSIIGKQTENYVDLNCNGEFEPDSNETDSDGNGELDQINDNDFVVLAVYNDPSNSKILSFNVNDVEEEFEFEDADFTDANEFHLLQVISDGDSLRFYLDNAMVLTTESDIMIQDNSLIIGAALNQSSFDNLWPGYIDEVRLWNENLADSLRESHFELPDKLVITMQDSTICNLTGLWTFNYSEAQADIIDEKCTEINNLYYTPCDFDPCDYPLDGMLYTIPGASVNFSTKGF